MTVVVAVVVVFVVFFVVFPIESMDHHQLSHCVICDVISDVI